MLLLFSILVAKKETFNVMSGVSVKGLISNSDSIEISDGFIESCNATTKKNTYIENPLIMDCPLFCGPLIESDSQVITDIERSQAITDIERALIGFVDIANSLFLVGARVVYFDKFNSKESALSKLVEVYVARQYSHINFSDDDIEKLIDNVIHVSMLDISKLRLSSHILTQFCQHGHCDASFQ